MGTPPTVQVMEIHFALNVEAVAPGMYKRTMPAGSRWRLGSHLEEATPSVAEQSLHLTAGAI
jgi:hypothetical protein